MYIRKISQTIFFLIYYFFLLGHYSFLNKILFIILYYTLYITINEKMLL